MSELHLPRYFFSYHQLRRLCSVKDDVDDEQIEATRNLTRKRENYAEEEVKDKEDIRRERERNKERRLRRYERPLNQQTK